MSCSGSEQTLSSCSNYVNYDRSCQTYKAGVVCEGEYIVTQQFLMYTSLFIWDFNQFNPTALLVMFNW